MFTEGVLMSVRDVAEYCEVSLSAITQQALLGHVDPIFIVKDSQNVSRIFYYPDIVVYKKYRQEKGKFDGYEPYLKKIDTSERQSVKKLLEKFIWNKDEVAEYLAVSSFVIDRLLKKEKLNVFYRFGDQGTRLFYVSDVKEFKLEYDTYRRFVSTTRRKRKKD